MTVERDANVPTIYVDGVETQNLKLLMVEDHLGEMPSRAIFQYVFGRDKIAPISMTPFSNGLSVKYGQRVCVKEPGSSRVVFNGWIMRRSDQGGPDKIILQAVCDKFLLQYMPVHGCLVRDTDATLRFSPRHNTKFNPDGAWNCTGFEWGGVTVPVFTPAAYRGSTYEAPTNAFDISTLTSDGKHTAWTPRRALQYLWLWANLANVAEFYPEGIDGDEIASLPASGPLTWDYDTISAMEGYESISQPNDPLDRKLQDITLQGKTVAGSIDTILAACGTHKMRINYEDSSAPTGTSKIVFMPVGYAPQGVGTAINVQRGGSVGAASCDVFDFNFDEDATTIAENVLVLGATKRVEARLEFKRAQGAGDYDADTTSSLLPAWTIAEEEAFRSIIQGGALGSAGDTYAIMPTAFGDTNIASYVQCTGTGVYPKVFARTAEAIALARSCFPTVFRAWRINGENASVQSYLTTDSGTTGGLKAPRPILPEQLQFMVRNLSGDDSTENRMFTKLPVRIEIQLDDYALTPWGGWMEVPRDIGVRVTGDGTIWIDGIAEGADAASNYSVININLTDVQQHIASTDACRKIRINAAFPADYRTKGSEFRSCDILDQPIKDALEGSNILRLVDSPGAYIHHIQNNSYPAASPSFYGGSTGSTPSTPGALTRDLPPGSEQTHADYAVKRLLARSMAPRREASFKFIGIRTDWRVGDRISYLNMNLQPDPGGGSPLTWQYNLSAPIGSIMHDYLNQITSVGGVATEFGGGVV